MTIEQNRMLILGTRDCYGSHTAGTATPPAKLIMNITTDMAAK